MRRFMIGAVALVTGLLAAGGVALTTRRRRNRDEVLQLDAAPPLAAGEPDEIAHASVEADFGPTVASAAEVPVAPKRKRVRRKPAKVAKEDAAATDGEGTEAGDAGTTTEARSEPASAEAEDPASAPVAAPRARTAEAAEIAAAAEAAELSGSPDLPSAS